MKTIAFDLSRMFVGAGLDTPRGIDRVDSGYATQFFADPATPNVGLMPSHHRMSVLGGAQTRRFAVLAERHWREDKTPGADALFAWLQKRLNGERLPRPAKGRNGQTRREMVLRYAKMLAQVRPSFFRPAVSAVPQGAVYLNTGQVLLGWGWCFDWLDRRPDVKPVFMLHDLIPLLYPEYSSPVLSRHHARAVETIVRRAAAMIATSHASADEIRDVFKARGRGDTPIHVVPLPVSDTFLAARSGKPVASDVPYFVTVGAIESRKNHLLLLHIWREMARRPGGPRPKLVIVGLRGQRSESLVNFFETCPGLDESVIEVNGLSTPAMRELMRDARALLMPSFTEGFGLPIVEALALGTPVIASDIPAHREVGGAFGACLLDPLDGPSWANELNARASESPAALEARRAALTSYQPQTWKSYFEEVLPFIDTL